ncbi:MAG: hypothetical protein U0641_12950 [Anaerolineae bacterium]
MANLGFKRINLDPDTDLVRVLEDVRDDGVPRHIERDGKPLAVVVNPVDYGATSEPTSKRMKDRLMSFAGIWSDLDADQLIEDIYAARHASPPSPLIEP